MRLDKFLSNLKYGSRSEIKKKIKAGFVKVNEKVIYKDDYKIDENIDKVKFEDKDIYYKSEITLMMNKPKDYISSNYDSRDKTIIDLLKEPYNRFDFYICGRLDKDTTGLIILTTNSSIQHELTHPKKNKYKKYLVKVENKINFFDLEKLNEGVVINLDNIEYKTLKAKTEKIDEYNFYLEIMEGKFHQVKKMVEAVNNKVIELKRIKIGDITLDKNLKLGEYKEINWE